MSDMHHAYREVVIFVLANAAQIIEPTTPIECKKTRTKWKASIEMPSPFAPKSVWVGGWAEVQGTEACGVRSERQSSAVAAELSVACTFAREDLLAPYELRSRAKKALAGSGPCTAGA